MIPLQNKTRYVQQLMATFPKIFFPWGCWRALHSLYVATQQCNEDKANYHQVINRFHILCTHEGKINEAYPLKGFGAGAWYRITIQFKTNTDIILPLLRGPQFRY